MEWMRLAERLQYGIHARRRVGDGEVDLAGGLVALVVGHHFRQRPVLFAERGQDVQRGQHPGVGAPEVAEVVVRRVLATENRPGLGHQPLDVGVADAGAHRRAAPLDDQFRHRPRGDQVVDHRAPISLSSSRAATSAVTADGRDGCALFVDDETPVGVAVEGQSDVGAGLDDVGLQVDEVGRVQRVGLVVGEGAVEFEEQRQQRDCRYRPKHAGVV